MALEIKIDLGSASREEVLAAMAALQTFDREALKNLPVERDLPEATRRPIPSQLPVNVHASIGATEVHELAKTATMTGDTPVLGAATMDLAQTVMVGAAAEPEEAPKPKRGRASKAEKEKAETLVQEAMVQEVVQEATPAIDLKPVPLDELRAALKSYVSAKGGDLTEGAKLLNKFGVQRVGELADLDPEQHAAFIAEVEDANA